MIECFTKDTILSQYFHSDGPFSFILSLFTFVKYQAIIVIFCKFNNKPKQGKTIVCSPVRTALKTMQRL